MRAAGDQHAERPEEEKEILDLEADRWLQGKAQIDYILCSEDIRGEGGVFHERAFKRDHRMVYFAGRR